jgi:hypothetical protein
MFSWLRNFRIDHLSFWLGFVSAGIALWLYKKVKISLPKIQEIKDKGIEVARQHQLSADEIYFNLSVLETAWKCCAKRLERILIWWAAAHL